MSDICDGFDECLIDSFTLKSYLGDDPFEARGKLIRYGYNRIFIKIFENDAMLKQNLYQMPFFDIFFDIKRQPYQFQHSALQFMEKCHLFNLLINNPKYDSVDADFDGGTTSW